MQQKQGTLPEASNAEDSERKDPKHRRDKNVVQKELGPLLKHRAQKVLSRRNGCFVLQEKLTPESETGRGISGKPNDKSNSGR